jgi:hypothetical protein
MQARLNRQLLQTTNIDSSALGMLAYVVHQFSSPGRYNVAVVRGGRTVAEVPFTVDEASEVMQLDVDLAAAERSADARPQDCECKDGSLMARVVSPKGYVLFYVSAGRGYSAVVTGARENVVFDTTKLGAGDVFAFSLLEPAVYELRNVTTGATAHIDVTLADESATRLRELPAVHIDPGQGKFDGERIPVTSTQGVVFRLDAPAHLVVRKTEKRQKPRAQPVRWENPRRRRA